MCGRFRFLFFLFLVLEVGAAHAQIQVYRWKDKDGRTVIGEAPPEGNPSVEKIIVSEPPPPSRPAAASRARPSFGKDLKKEEAALEQRMEARRKSEAAAEQAREKRQNACADARARQAYVDSIRGRTVWRTDPATGEQTPIPDDERGAMEADVTNAMRMNDCEAM
ncbi:MAG: DUF4124 domain-containing protein [Candidatus Accumulibacter sp.]|jgi:hypothetical protein|nr:DUF4124 domain-containing protein [Accumulibacter sp.]